MSIQRLLIRDRTRWNDYVAHSGTASCYHRFEWQDIIEKSFGHATWYYFSENEKGHIDGILPLVQMKSALFGNFMVSLPYFTYGGICADSSSVERSLLDHAITLAGERKAEHIELRHTQRMDSGLPVKTAKVSMQLSLPGSAENLWQSFSSKLRSQVQRAVKEGMYARVGREEALDDFYGVFSANMRDLGTPVYSRDFFRNILKEFPASAWICTVETRDRIPVAAGFLVGFKGSLEIPWASSLRRYNRFGPNMLLYWSALRFACEKGYQRFDFGRSTPGEGTYKFKAQWGAEPVSLYWHYWLRNGNAVPELNPRNPKYKMAITIWKRLPLRLTNLIGPAIVKNLP
jgi:FemAB-related protein (PEP-CTERM system-associated)